MNPSPNPFPCEYCGTRMTTEQNLRIHKWKYCKVLHPELQQQTPSQPTGQFWHQQQTQPQSAQPFAKQQTLFIQQAGQVPQFVVPSVPVPTQTYQLDQATLIQRAVREAMQMKEEKDACASNDFPGKMPSLATFNPTASANVTSKTAASLRVKQFHLCPQCYDVSEKATIVYTPDTGSSQHIVHMCSPCGNRFIAIKQILEGRQQPVGMSITCEQTPPTTMDVTITSAMEPTNGSMEQKDKSAHIGPMEQLRQLKPKPPQQDKKAIKRKKSNAPKSEVQHPREHVSSCEFRQCGDRMKQPWVKEWQQKAEAKFFDEQPPPWTPYDGFFCKICERGMSKKSRIEHMRWHRRNTRVSFNFKCKHCGHWYASQRTLQQHQKRIREKRLERERKKKEREKRQEEKKKKSAREERQTEEEEKQKKSAREERQKEEEEKKKKTEREQKIINLLNDFEVWSNWSAHTSVFL